MNEPSYPKDVVWRPMKGSQEAFLASTPIFEVLFEGTRGGGKCIANTTPVLTQRGWVEADKVKLTDQLVAMDGSYTDILGIYPQPPQKMFELTFSDGQKIVAGEDHNWLVTSNKNTDRPATVRKTKEMTSNEWSVPFMSAPHSGRQWTGYDPYVLGLIAGDGTIHGQRSYVTIYSCDEEILNAVDGWKIQKNSKWSTSRVSADLETSIKIASQVERYSKAAIGILEADAESRLAYLQGLMDSDGTVDKYEGKPSFCNTSETLAKLAHDLCWSLGGRATICLKKFSGGRDKWYYQVAIAHQNKFNPFRLSRKADLVISQKKYMKRCIRDIREVATVPSICFAVSHPSHTFVIEGYVVTHNTDSLLMSYCMHVGKGFGAAWKGILFRQTYKQLSDVISKTQKWIPQIWPTAKFNHAEHTWTWPSGEKLLLRQFTRPDDYWNYHGHEYPWIGWEELCNWPWDDGYKRMFSCCRSSQKGMPRMIRATTNPYGPGHNWVKMRFRLPGHNLRVIKDSKDEEGNIEPPRLSIKSHIDENIALLEADPGYKQTIAASARSQAERKAWLEGSWDIVAGGMFDDVYNPKYNVIKPFNIPENWRDWRSFDWGESAPFSVGWWAIANGEDFQQMDGSWRSSIKGDLFRINEWYGWTGKPNEGLKMLATDIAEGIVMRELRWGLRRRHENWCRVSGGVADSQIFAAENGNCIATDMKVRSRLPDGFRYPGIIWQEADKRPGSRATGWVQMRQALKNAHPRIEYADLEETIVARIYPREKPGLFITTNCLQFIRTVPVLPRDEKDMDDVNTEAEDHVADETRYFIRGVKQTSSTGGVVGNW